MKTVINFLKEVKSEIDLVTWPKRKEVIKSTVIVLLVSAITGLYVGGLDFAFTKTLETLFVK